MSVRKFSTASILSPSYKNSKIWDGETFPGYFESIQTITVGSTSVASIEFTNIPNNYAHLQIRGFARTTRATFGVDALRYQFNSDTGTNYSWHHVRGDGSSTEASAGSTVGYMESQRILGTTTGASFGAFIIDILDYSNTNKYTTTRVLGGVDVNGTVGGIGGAVALTSGSWRNVNAITSIKLYGDSANFAEFSHFALYGIRS